MGSVNTGFGGVIGAFGLVRLRALPLRWLQHLRISVRIVVTVIGSPGIPGTHLTSLFGRSLRIPERHWTKPGGPAGPGSTCAPPVSG